MVRRQNNSIASQQKHCSILLPLFYQSLSSMHFEESQPGHMKQRAIKYEKVENISNVSFMWLQVQDCYGFETFLHVTTKILFPM
jgi:hypothetical protein